MSTSREGLGFFGKRDEAKSLLQELFFAPPTLPIPDEKTGGLTSSRFIDYDSVIDRLEELVVEGMEQEVRRRYGGREEGM